jgi:hypothetical protein
VTASEPLTRDVRSRRPTPGTVFRRVVPSVLVNGALSTGVYFLLRRTVGSDVVALALTGAIPALWTLGRFAWRRTLDPIGALAFAGYVLAVVVALLSGGGALALELREPVLTGALGLVCLASAAVGRPLHRWLLHLLDRRDRAAPRVEHAPSHRRFSTAITLLVGGTLVTHAAALVILAVTLPPSSYMALRHPVGLPILGLGVAALVWYRNRRRAHAPGN